MNRLPVRLKAIADQLSPGASVADIGLDHALLSIYLVASGRSRRLIGVENQAGPYLKAQEAVQTAGLGAQIELRFGSGLSPIEPGEVDEVVIAGMGGETIVGILETELARASSIRRFIFQPMTRPECLRAFLGAQGWPIIGETAVSDHGRFYILIIASPGSNPYRLSPLQLDVGPIMLTRNDESSRNFQRFMLRKFRNRLSGLQISRQKSSKERISDILVEIHELEARLNELEG